MDILNRYRDNRDSSSSDEDSENSDNECAVWKRAKNPNRDNNQQFPTNGMQDEPVVLPNEQKEEIAEPQQLPKESEPKPGAKRKRNTIWSDVLQDQLISEDLEDCLLHKPRNYGSRGKESYDYTRAYGGEKKEDSDSEMSGCSMNEDSGADSWPKSKKMRSSFPVRKSFKKFVKLDSSELDAARKINKVLQEKKWYLIQRVVKYAGIDKAMHFLELTKKVEDEGGMMTMDQRRRRTAGGIYLHLLKSDKDISKEIVDKIFEGEMSGYELKKFYEQKRKKRRNKKKNSKRNSEETSKKEVFNEPMELNIQPMEAEDNVDVKVEDNVDVKAEDNVDVKPDVLNLDTENTPMPVIDNKSSENVSDLEEGEIEE